MGSLNHLIKELRKYHKSVESKRPAKIERERDGDEGMVVRNGANCSYGDDGVS